MKQIRGQRAPLSDPYPSLISEIRAAATRG